MENKELLTLEAWTQEVANALGEKTGLTTINAQDFAPLLKTLEVSAAQYPTFTNPIFSASVSNLYGIYGAEYNGIATLTFDRGKIDPAYGTSGYRAGLPTSYEVNGNITETNETVCDIEFNIANINAGNNVVIAKVNYSEGEQPKNSNGMNYDIPYAAGSMQCEINVIGLTAAFTGSTNVEPTENNLPASAITDSSSASHELVGVFEELNDSGEVTGRGYQITTIAAAADFEAQSILLPSSVTLVGIKFWDVLQVSWQWLGGTQENSISREYFIASETPIIKTINGVEVEYTEYLWNVDVYDISGGNNYRFFVE